MHVAVIQFSVLPGAIKRNEEVAEQLICQAVESGVDAVVLPELWNCGYDLSNLSTIAQSFQDSSVNLLKRLAHDHRIYIFGGSIAEKKDGIFHNTAVVIDARGTIICKYRKIHLFPIGIEEDKFFSPGNEWGLVNTPWGTIGLLLCFDIRFPELARNLVLRGANMLICPAQFPAARLDHWTTLCKARAIENQVFLIAANRTGQDRDTLYPGHSMIISPWGEILAESDDMPNIITARLNLDEVPHVRSKIPCLDRRINILDEIDDSQI